MYLSVYKLRIIRLYLLRHTNLDYSFHKTNKKQKKVHKNPKKSVITPYLIGYNGIFSYFCNQISTPTTTPRRSYCLYFHIQELFMQNIPTVTRNLLIVNVVVFIATTLLTYVGLDLNRLLGLHFILASNFTFISS